MSPNEETEPELHEVLWRKYEEEKAKLPPMLPEDYEKAVKEIIERLGL